MTSSRSRSLFQGWPCPACLVTLGGPLKTDPGGHCCDRESNNQRPHGQQEGRGRPEGPWAGSRCGAWGWSAMSHTHCEPSPGVEAHRQDPKVPRKALNQVSPETMPLCFFPNQRTSSALDCWRPALQTRSWVSDPEVGRTTVPTSALEGRVRAAATI